MPARMTSTAWAQGLTNATICGLGLLAVVAVGTGFVAWTTGLPLSEAVALAFGALVIATNLAFYAILARDLWTRGRLLLDCGPHPTRWLFMVEGLALLVFTVATFPHSTRMGSFLAVAALLFLVFSSGRLQVRDNGLWQYWSLLRWDRVAEYHWADDATLILRGRGMFHFLRGALPVPPEKQAEVEALLKEKRGQEPFLSN